MRVDPSGPRGASSGDVLPPPSSIGAVAADVPPPTTSNDSDIRRTLDHVLTVQTAHEQIWWTCSMRSVLCAPSWHNLDDLHCHLPFDDGF